MYQKNKTSVKIGDLAKLTGLSVLRIRAWESRFGVPQALRRPSGHRYYGPEEVYRMQLIAQGIRQGVRVGKLVKLDVDVLKSRLTLPVLSAPATPKLCEFSTTSLWMEKLKTGDDRAFFELLLEEWGLLGAISFVEERVLPFARHMALSSEYLGVGRHRVAQQFLEHFLNRKWWRRNRSNEGEAVLVAGLAGLSRSLQTVCHALVASFAGFHVFYPGMNFGSQDLMLMAQEFNVRWILVDFGEREEGVQGELEHFVRLLPSDIRFATVMGECLKEKDMRGSYKSMRFNDFRALFDEFREIGDSL